MPFIRPQTRWPIQLWMLCPASYRTALNTRFANAGYGPDTFSAGLSVSGNAPATFYHTLMTLKVEHIQELVWLCNQASVSRMWFWIRAREEVLNYLVQWHKDQVSDNLNKPEFKNLNWQTRANAYVKLGTEPIKPTAALAWLADNAVPAARLIPIR